MSVLVMLHSHRAVLLLLLLLSCVLVIIIIIIIIIFRRQEVIILLPTAVNNKVELKQRLLLLLWHQWLWRHSRKQLWCQQTQPVQAILLALVMVHQHRSGCCCRRCCVDQVLLPRCGGAGDTCLHGADLRQGAHPSQGTQRALSISASYAQTLAHGLLLMISRHLLFPWSARRTTLMQDRL